MLPPPGPDVVVFDTETTGCTGWDRVVSLGAVRLDGDTLEPVATLHLVFDPGRRCHPGAARVHGLSDSYLRRQPRFEDHAGEVARFFGATEGGPAATGCAHNLAFDRRMLGAEFDRLGLPRPWGAEACTLRAWRAARPGARAGLDAASAALGLAREGALHGALEDALLAAQILRALARGLPPARGLRPHGFSNARRAAEGEAMAA